MQDAIEILPLRNLRSIVNLINSVDEDDAAHLELNNSEIIEMVQEAEEEEEQEEEQFLLMETSKEKKLKSLGIFVSFRCPSVCMPPLRVISILGFTSKVHSDTSLNAYFGIQLYDFLY